MATDVWTYSKLLAEQLRINGMKERQVSEVVAQVQEHVLTTGENALEAFGSPNEYARQWLAPTRNRWIRRILGGVAGVTSLFALAKGLSASGTWAAPVDVGASAAVMWAAYVVSMAVLPWTLELWLARRRAHRFGVAGGVQNWVFRLVAIALFMAAVSVVIFVVLDGRSDLVAFTLPRWALLLVGVVCLPGLAFIGWGGRDALPEVPGPVSWKTRMRRALINR